MIFMNFLILDLFNCFTRNRFGYFLAAMLVLVFDIFLHCTIVFLHPTFIHFKFLHMVFNTTSVVCTKGCFFGFWPSFHLLKLRE